MALQPVDISSGQVSGVDSLSSAASSVVNWELDEAGINRPRPGLSSYAVAGLGTSPVIGMVRWKNYIVAVSADRRLWAIDDAVPLFAMPLSTLGTAGTRLEGSSRPVFAQGESAIYVTGGGRIQKWSPSLGFSEVIAASPVCTHVVAMGERLVTNVSRDDSSASTFSWSDIGEGVWNTWPVANNANANARPDPIVAITENTSELIIFGTETTQSYGNGSDPTFPFEQAATVNIGIAAPYAYARMDDNFALLDSRRRVVLSDGRSLEPISDAIGRDLRGMTTISDCWMYREERGQQSLLVVRFPTNRRTLVYDLKGKRWTERDYYAAPFHADFPVGAHAYSPAANLHLFGSALTGGGMLRLDEDSRVDLGAGLVCERTTGWQDFGSMNRKRSCRLRLVLRRGTAAQGAAPGALELRTQADDGPWSPWRQIDLGVPSDYQQTRDVFAGGIFRRRRYGLRYSSSEETSLVSLHDDVTDLEATT